MLKVPKAVLKELQNKTSDGGFRAKGPIYPATRLPYKCARFQLFKRTAVDPYWTLNLQKKKTLFLVPLVNVVIFFNKVIKRIREPKRKQFSFSSWMIAGCSLVRTKITWWPCVHIHRWSWLPAVLPSLRNSFPIQRNIPFYYSTA